MWGRKNNPGDEVYYMCKPKKHTKAPRPASLSIYIGALHCRHDKPIKHHIVNPR
jgi:hypothetical protein